MGRGSERLPLAEAQGAQCVAPGQGAPLSCHLGCGSAPRPPFSPPRSSLPWGFIFASPRWAQNTPGSLRRWRPFPCCWNTARKASRAISHTEVSDSQLAWASVTRPGVSQSRWQKNGAHWLVSSGLPDTPGAEATPRSRGLSMHAEEEMDDLHKHLMREHKSLKVTCNHGVACRTLPRSLSRGTRGRPASSPT